MRKSRQGSSFGDLQRINGVSAVPPDSSTPSRSPSPSASGRPTGSVPGVPPEEVKIFQQAGWSFVGKEGRSRSGGGHPVFKDGDGRLKIDSGNVNVQFAASASQEDIDKVLSAQGLAIRRRLEFQPNLFTVTTVKGHATDSVKMAKSLQASDKVDFAEPVLIEATGKRGE